MVETIFLAVLVLSLIIGNALLFFTGGSSSRTAVASPAGNLGPELPSDNGNSFNSAPAVDATYAFGSRFRLLDQKVMMAHSRLNDVERRLSMPSSNSVSPEGLELLNREVKKLNEFKANAQIEIAAIKQLLSEMRSSPAAPKGRLYEAEIKRAGEGIDDLEERIRSIVYRAGK